MQQLADEEIYVESCEYCDRQYFGEPFFCCPKKRTQLMDDPLYGYKQSKNTQLIDLNFLDEIPNERTGKSYKYNNNLIYFDSIDSDREALILVWKKTKYKVSSGFAKSIKIFESKNQWKNFVGGDLELRNLLLRAASKKFLDMDLENHEKKQESLEQEEILEIGDIMNMVQEVADRSIEREEGWVIPKNADIESPNIQNFKGDPFGEKVKINTSISNEKVTSMEFKYKGKGYRIRFKYTLDNQKIRSERLYPQKRIFGLELKQLNAKAKSGYKEGTGPWIPDLHEFVLKELKKFHQASN